VAGTARSMLRSRNMGWARTLKSKKWKSDGPTALRHLSNALFQQTANIQLVDKAIAILNKIAICDMGFMFYRHAVLSCSRKLRNAEFLSHFREVA